MKVIPAHLQTPTSKREDWGKEEFERFMSRPSNIPSRFRGHTGRYEPKNASEVVEMLEHALSRLPAGSPAADYATGALVRAKAAAEKSARLTRGGPAMEAFVQHLAREHGIDFVNLPNYAENWLEIYQAAEAHFPKGSDAHFLASTRAAEFATAVEGNRANDPAAPRAASILRGAAFQAGQPANSDAARHTEQQRERASTVAVAERAAATSENLFVIK